MAASVERYKPARLRRRPGPPTCERISLAVHTYVRESGDSQVISVLRDEDDFHGTATPPVPPSHKISALVLETSHKSTCEAGSSGLPETRKGTSSLEGWVLVTTWSRFLFDLDKLEWRVCAFFLLLLSARLLSFSMTRCTLDTPKKIVKRSQVWEHKKETGGSSTTTKVRTTANMAKSIITSLSTTVRLFMLRLWTKREKSSPVGFFGNTAETSLLS